MKMSNADILNATERMVKCKLSLHFFLKKTKMCALFSAVDILHNASSVQLPCAPAECGLFVFMSCINGVCVCVYAAIKLCSC